MKKYWYWVGTGIGLAEGSERVLRETRREKGVTVSKDMFEREEEGR